MKQEITFRDAARVFGYIDRLQESVKKLHKTHTRISRMFVKNEIDQVMQLLRDEMELDASDSHEFYMLQYIKDKNYDMFLMDAELTALRFADRVTLTDITGIKANKQRIRP